MCIWGSVTSPSNSDIITKFRLKLKNVQKTTRPFRYDLNQIPYAYTVEVTNRFKRLDLIDMCLKNYGWRFVTLYSVRECLTVGFLCAVFCLS